MSDLITLPVGRLVSGSLTQTEKIDYKGQPIPEEKQRFSFGVAVPKDDLGLPGVFQALRAEAMTDTGHAALPAVVNMQLEDGYSWKVKDGDRPNSRGEVNENTRGCFVFYFTTSYLPNTCDNTNTACDAAIIKRGYYVDVVFSAVNNHNPAGTAGIFLNPQWVRHIAYGPEITGGISAKDAFADAPVPQQLPPGASRTPLVGNPAPAAAPATPPVMPGTPQSAVLPTASPSNPAPSPAHDLVSNAIGKPLPGLPS